MLQVGTATRRSRKDERIETRVTPAQKRLIERAAALRGTSITDFVVASAQEAAANTIREFDILRLHDGARDAFVKAVLRPPAPNPAARAAVRRYRRNMGI